MVGWLKKYWPALILVALLVALLDGVLSSLITCHPAGATPNSSGNSQQNQECTALAGPIPVALIGVIDFLDKHGEAVVGIFTIVLAASTGRLWYSTEKLWGSTNRSAEIAERALTELERPFITVEVLQSGLTFTANGTITSPISDFKYQFVNHGRTPAQLIELVESWPIVDRIQHPTDPNKFQSVQPPPIDPKAQGARRLPFGVVVSKDRPFELSANAIAVIDIQRVTVRPFFHSLGSDLYFCGYVRYQDIFDKRYIFGFCAVYDFIGRRFLLMGDSRYNYTHREDGPEQETPPSTLAPGT